MQLTCNFALPFRSWACWWHQRFRNGWRQACISCSWCVGPLLLRRLRLLLQLLLLLLLLPLSLFLRLMLPRRLVLPVLRLPRLASPPRRSAARKRRQGGGRVPPRVGVAVAQLQLDDLPLMGLQAEVPADLRLPPKSWQQPPAR